MPHAIHYSLTPDDGQCTILQPCANTGTRNTNFCGFNTAIQQNQSIGKADSYYVCDGSCTAHQSVEDTSLSSVSTPNLSRSADRSARSMFSNQQFEIEMVEISELMQTRRNLSTQTIPPECDEDFKS